MRGTFINVVRDGRAVVNSWLQMGWWDGWQLEASAHAPDQWLVPPAGAP